MRLRRNIVRRNEVVRQVTAGLLRCASRHGVLVDQGAICQQLETKHIDLLFGFLASPDHVAEIVVRKARLDTVARIIGQRQGNRAGRCNRAVMREPCTRLCQRIDQGRVFSGYSLHVPAVPRMQNPTRHLVADLVTVGHHLRSLAQHLLGDLELLVHDRRRAFLL